MVNLGFTGAPLAVWEAQTVRDEGRGRDQQGVSDTGQVGKDAGSNQSSSDRGEEKWPDSGCIFIIFCQSLPEDLFYPVLTTFKDRSQNGVTLISIGNAQETSLVFH